MSPRGYYTKEIIHPHFTTDLYKKSDAYRHEMEVQEKIEKIFWYTPKGWVLKVWRFVRSRFGKSGRK